MEPKIIRQKFIEKFGKEKYIEFVLSLYDEFPLRNYLLFWQEQLLKKLTNDLKTRPIKLIEAYTIFNRCPLHDLEVKSDKVPIINGNTFKDNNLRREKTKQFPLDNLFVLRDLDNRKYPRKIDILYCSVCRAESKKRMRNGSDNYRNGLLHSVADSGS